MDYELPMIEFQRPDGTQIDRSIKCDEATYRKYEQMKAHGFFLTVEFLSYDTAAFTISDDEFDYVVKIFTADGNANTMANVAKFNIDDALKLREKLRKGL